MRASQKPEVLLHGGTNLTEPARKSDLRNMIFNTKTVQRFLTFGWMHL